MSDPKGVSSSPVQESPVLCLASASPRRRELLAQIGVGPIAVQPVDVDESPQQGESPTAYVERLARHKAQVGAAMIEHALPVLGGDTAVVLKQRILGKPADFEQAREMLRQLSGKTHEVLSGVAVTGPAGIQSAVVTTRVRFRHLSDSEIERYWASGEPCDKAGAYGIQGLGSVFVQDIRGSYSAVVGLPLYETARLLSIQRIPVWRLEQGSAAEG
ncbi:septum formation protein Maf [Terasakiispira papahanaumokuakeensis]|uniref:dTTP/UTP pyrophosphatase n=1 Tax=Terasakiispira papahanaumokuakeensis TaxID=197479 RepID=A0A1E2V6P7_9GAMM|nr:nucleoside triphosphate pyrophosphatase [Terasakiispira papahanaumokuakeensis]ODC02657.1 septum formation protein Maf [Terasakiispira papahanaumokuakeensis]